MKWKTKPGTGQLAIVSDCGQYQITKFTCGGVDLFMVYQGGNEIGNAQDGNEARRVAERHKAKGVTS